MIKKYKGFIFDMNGTMVDDMHYHEDAWYDVLVNELKAPLSREQVKNEMYGSQHEMFHRVFGDKYTNSQIDEISMRKEVRYRAQFLPQLQLIDGLDTLLKQCRQKEIKLSIGTAAPPENVDFVLDNLNIRSYFPVIIGVADVKKSKPDPEVFLKAAQRMSVLPEECIVFEDAPKGIEAARRAGMDAVGITSHHGAKALENANVVAIILNYHDRFIEHLAGNF